MMASCKAVVFLPLAVLLALGIPATAVAQNAQNAKLRPADSILANGQVYTEKGAPSWAQAVAVRGEKIIAVGDDAGILKLRGPATKALDAGGKLVLPGFCGWPHSFHERLHQPRSSEFRRRQKPR